MASERSMQGLLQRTFTKPPRLLLGFGCTVVDNDKRS